MRGAILACVAIVLVPATPCLGQFGPTVTFSIGLHHGTPTEDFNKGEAERMLAMASSLYNDARGFCNDTRVCLSLRADGNPANTTWSSPNQQYPPSIRNGINLDVLDATPDTALIKTILATITSPQIKLVRSIRVGQQDMAGVTDYRGLNTVIDYRSNETTWAHEFGHMCGLLDAPQSCSYLIMKDDDAQYRYAITPSEAEDIEEFLYLEAGGSSSIATETTACEPMSIAWLDNLEAIHTVSGVHVSFETRHELYTDSFEVQRVDSLYGSPLYTLGTAASHPESSVIGLRYSINDPYGS